MRFGIISRLHIGAAAAALSLTFSLAPGKAVAAPPVLNRNLDAYFALAEKFLRVKNFSLNSACNIGVNCPQVSANGKVGFLTFDAAFGADGSQFVGARTFCSKKPANLWDHFTNDDTNGSCQKNIVRDPLITPPPPFVGFTAPILGDLNGNSQPSCKIDNGQAIIDYGDIETGCGFPAGPFPTCDPSKPVKAIVVTDCAPFDTTAGNGRCDLPPGVYGDLNVQNDAKLVLSAGNYVFCNVNISRRTLVTAKGTTIFVPDGGFVKANNDTVIGENCGDLTILKKGLGQVRFGRRMFIAAKVCAPQAKMNLGHSNNLLGQFIGDQVEADLDNNGRCCGGHCTCIDTFDPTSAKVGDVVTMDSGCDLTNATGVTICGVNAPIQSKTASELKVKVGVGTPTGACPVVVQSAPGSFKANGTITITP